MVSLTLYTLLVVLVLLVIRNKGSNLMLFSLTWKKGFFYPYHCICRVWLSSHQLTSQVIENLNQLHMISSGPCTNNDYHYTIESSMQHKKYKEIFRNNLRWGKEVNYFETFLLKIHNITQYCMKLIKRYSEIWSLVRGG